jgi:ABC-2 type transport system permease protein/lipopolysaccharide transport system permease protein
MSANSSLEYAFAPSVVACTEAALLPAPSRVADALSDLWSGFTRAWMWSALAYQDIKLRYRGSLLGPFWITLTNLVLLVAMGEIYATLFKVETSTYIPFLMTGLLVWQFLSTVVNESCSTFTAAEDVIQQVPLPFSIQAYRTVYRNLIVLAHNAVIIPFGLILFRVPVNWHVLAIFPALLVLCANGLWISLLLGTISTRFRDVPPIVANAVQVVFFVTPIFWPIEAVGDWKPLLMLSPVYAAIDVVRAPLLGQAISLHSWPILLVCTAVGAAFGLGFFVRFRERIAYWI